MPSLTAAERVAPQRAVSVHGRAWDAIVASGAVERPATGGSIVRGGVPILFLSDFQHCTICMLRVASKILDSGPSPVLSPG